MWERTLIYERENMIDLSVEIAGIKMKNPIMPASGTFGYGEEFSDLIEISRLGAVMTKAVTLNPRPGNEPPRALETPAGMINRIGLANPGVEEVVRKKLPYLEQFGIPIIVNVSGSTVDEYVEVVKQVSASSVVSGCEINISCPNVKQGGLAFGQDPASAAGVAVAVRRVTSLPLIFKLTPNVASVVPVARAVVEAGADAISLVNTFLARAKIWNGPFRGQYVEGGLSGPCIRAMAVRIVSDLAKANLGVPIIGIGGIRFVEDVIEFLESGAVAVEVGTANFVNPLVMIELIEGLGVYIERTRCQSLKEWREKGFPMPKEK